MTPSIKAVSCLLDMAAFVLGKHMKDGWTADALAAAALKEQQGFGSQGAQQWQLLQLVAELKSMVRGLPGRSV
jgi:hypothetical protein